jgi:hypothetical protein
VGGWVWVGGWVGVQLCVGGWRGGGGGVGGWGGGGVVEVLSQRYDTAFIDKSPLYSDFY